MKSDHMMVVNQFLNKWGQMARRKKQTHKGSSFDEVIENEIPTDNFSHEVQCYIYFISSELIHHQ